MLDGDVNGDLKVDSQDLIVIFQAGKYETGEAATYEEGDLDGNGLVESADLIILLQNYEREVLHHMVFGDGTFVIEKKPDQSGEFHTFARVFVPTSKDPLIEFEIESFHIVETGEASYQVYGATTDDKEVTFVSITFKGKSLVAAYGVAESIQSERHREPLRRTSAYALVNEEGRHFFVLVSMDWVVDKRPYPFIQRIHQTRDLQGNLLRNRLLYYAADGRTVEIISDTGSFTGDGFLTVREASGHGLFQASVTHLVVTTEESSGLLKAVSATAEDGRVISVVVTQSGLDVDLLAGEPVREAVESNRFPDGLTRVTSFIVVGDGKGGQQVVPHQIRLLDSEGHDMQLTTYTYEQTTGELFAVYTRYSEVVQDHTKLRLALTRTHVGTKDETAQLFMNDNEFTGTLDLVPDSIQLTSEIPSGLFETLTATAEDGRVISVVVTQSGLDVDLLRENSQFAATVTAAF